MHARKRSVARRPSTRHPTCHVKNHHIHHDRNLQATLSIRHQAHRIAKLRNPSQKQPRPTPSHVLGATQSKTIPSFARAPPEIPAPGAISPPTDPPRSPHQVSATSAIAELAQGTPPVSAVSHFKHQWFSPRQCKSHSRMSYSHGTPPTCTFC
jgi:hypothetical protein